MTYITCPTRKIQFIECSDFIIIPNNTVFGLSTLLGSNSGLRRREIKYSNIFLPPSSFLFMSLYISFTRCHKNYFTGRKYPWTYPYIYIDRYP